MKVCIILPNLLPVPSVKGGAIERLINDIIDQNEKDKKLDIMLCSIYDKKAEQESKKYTKTKFIYIKKNLKYFLRGIFVRILNLFGKNLNTYNSLVLDKIKKQKFDYIIVEDGVYKRFKTYLKYFDKEQMIVHFHHNGESDKETDATYSTYIGVSAFVANTFKNSSTISDIQVLRNGINIDKFMKTISDQEKANVRNKLGFKQNDFVIIFCGRLIQEKGVLELVKAVKAIENENIKMMIVGSINFGNGGTSDYLEKLRSEIDSSNDKIKLTGYINNNELYKYYQSADIGIIPSVWEDAAPLVTIEVMINKLPLIVTRTGGAPEYASKESIIVPKDKNLTENLKNEIVDLYNDKDRMEKMSKEGYKHAMQFSTQKFYNDFVEILYRKAGKND